MEKLKENKKVIGIVCAVLAIVVIAVLCATFVKPSYKAQIKKIAGACESEENMKKFVKKDLNLRALYAMQKAAEKNTESTDIEDSLKDFEKEYKKAKKSDYLADDFVDEIYETYEFFTDLDKVEITDIKELKKADDMGDFYKKMYGKVKGMKIAKFKLKVKADGEKQEVECDAIFYKGKLVAFSPSLEDIYEQQEQMRQNIQDTQDIINSQQEELERSRELEEELYSR